MSVHEINQLVALVNEQNWTELLAQESSIVAMVHPGPEYARVLYGLAHARWHRGQDATDYVAAIRYTRAAAQLDPLNGRILHGLGSFLITIGHYAEGTRVLQRWIARHRLWSTADRSRIGDVQYALGYAARYSGDLARAEIWYSAAHRSYMVHEDYRGAGVTLCALATAQARLGYPEKGLATLSQGHFPPDLQGYELAARAQIYAARGSRALYQLAIDCAEEALTALGDAADADPWEMAELHVLIADLGSRLGDDGLCRQQAGWAVDMLHASPRHNLYTVARLILDHEWKEVAV